MDKILVKDLMIPLADYAVVQLGSTLSDAVVALEHAQQYLAPGKQPHRAILIADRDGHIVGKVGQFALLKALEPKYSILGDIETIQRPGIDSMTLRSMMEHLRLFNDSLQDHCRAAARLKVDRVMSRVTQTIDEDADLAEAIHKIIIWQTLSILVARDNKIIGVLRLSDIFDRVSKCVKASAETE
jgi:CBS domain-containing protein